MHITKTACQWRRILKEFGLWQTEFFYFRIWKFEGVFEKLMHILRQTVRKEKRKNASPRIGRTFHHDDSKEYGIEGGKKEKGRKKHIIVDSLGLLLKVRLRVANIHDSVSEDDAIKFLQYEFSRQKKIIPDGGYIGNLADMVTDYGWKSSVVLHRKNHQRNFRYFHPAGLLN